MGTFSKAFGVVGGHVVGSKDLINYAYNKSRTWLLSGAQAPAVLAACTASIEVLETEPQHVKNVWKNTAYFKKAVNDLGFNTGNSATPIIPIICGESHKARQLSETLWSHGIYVLPIVFPMVSKDSARIRCQMHAQMTKEDLDFAVREIADAGKTLGIIK
jgi:glycine C-acetyltransferase